MNDFLANKTNIYLFRRHPHDIIQLIWWLIPTDFSDCLLFLLNASLTKRGLFVNVTVCHVRSARETKILTHPFISDIVPTNLQRWIWPSADEDVVSTQKVTALRENKVPLDVIKPQGICLHFKWTNTDVRRRSQVTTLVLWFHVLGNNHPQK